MYQATKTHVERSCARYITQPTPSLGWHAAILDVRLSQAQGEQNLVLNKLRTWNLQCGPNNAMLLGPISFGLLFFCFIILASSSALFFYSNDVMMTLKQALHTHPHYKWQMKGGMKGELGKTMAAMDKGSCCCRGILSRYLPPPSYACHVVLLATSPISMKPELPPQWHDGTYS